MVSIEVLHASHDHGGHGVGDGHGHAPPQATDGDGPLGGSSFVGSSSPLWWSAWQRLACATLLVALLWLVIAWAVA
jgi:hypothetical protein